MRIPKSIFFITIAIIVGVVIFLLALPDASKTSVTETTSSAEETYSIDDTFFTERMSEENEPLPEDMVTEEIKLLYYYVFLTEERFRDILTENDVRAIIEELKQFQPEALAKFLHHDAEMFQVVETRISATQLSPNPDNMRYHLNYEYNDIKYKISFSPTIEQIWLRGRTEKWRTNLLQKFPYDNGNLFMQLASTKNNNIIPLIQFFLDNGVDINTKNPNSNGTIFTAVGTLEIAQFLLKNGADPTIVTKSNGNPLRYAISFERSNELIRLLIDLGVDLNIRSTFDGENALDTAKDKVKGLEYDIWRTHETDDESPGDELLPARIEKAEEVVRIIEQALEAEKKS